MAGTADRALPGDRTAGDPRHRVPVRQRRPGRRTAARARGHGRAASGQASRHPGRASPERPGAWPLTGLEPVGPVPTPAVAPVPELAGSVLPAAGFEAPAMPVLVPPTPGTASHAPRYRCRSRRAARRAGNAGDPRSSASGDARHGPVTVGSAPPVSPVTVPVTAGSVPAARLVAVPVTAGSVFGDHGGSGRWNRVGNGAADGGRHGRGETRGGARDRRDGSGGDRADRAGDVLDRACGVCLGGRP